jgi:hypothetical protein
MGNVKSVPVLKHCNTVSYKSVKVTVHASMTLALRKWVLDVITVVHDKMYT